MALLRGMLGSGPAPAPAPACTRIGSACIRTQLPGRGPGEATHAKSAALGHYPAPVREVRRMPPLPAIVRRRPQPPIAPRHAVAMPHRRCLPPRARARPPTCCSPAPPPLFAPWPRWQWWWLRCPGAAPGRLEGARAGGRAGRRVWRLGAGWHCTVAWLGVQPVMALPRCCAVQPATQQQRRMPGWLWRWVGRHTYLRRTFTCMHAAHGPRLIRIIEGLSQDHQLAVDQ
jgi:hypothetical protein